MQNQTLWGKRELQQFSYEWQEKRLAMKKLTVFKAISQCVVSIQPQLVKRRCLWICCAKAFTLENGQILSLTFFCDALGSSEL